MQIVSIGMRAVALANLRLFYLVPFLSGLTLLGMKRTAALTFSLR
jgi:hypothetical protein